MPITNRWHAGEGSLYLVEIALRGACLGLPPIHTWRASYCKLTVPQYDVLV